ncbi:MAG: J domain-containing protein [Bacteroidota bacterium]
MYRNYYQILNVDTQAEAAEIKQAYRRLAKLYHPDSNSDPDAKQQFVSISQAYEVLIDPDKRWRYDLLINYGTAHTYKPPPPAQPTPAQQAATQDAERRRAYKRNKAAQEEEKFQEFAKYRILSKAICMIGLLLTSILFVDGLLSSADGLDRIQEVKRFADSNGSIVYRISTNHNQFRLSEEIGTQFQKGDLIALQKTPLLGIHTYVEKWEPSPLMGTKLLDVYQDRDHPFKGMIRVLRVPPSIGILNIFIFIPILAWLASIVGTFWTREKPMFQFQIALMSVLFTILSLMILALS